MHTLPANFLVGFVTPWIFGWFLYRKDPLVIITIGPTAALIAAVFDAIGLYFEFWDFTPVIEQLEIISTIPIELGFDFVLGCYAIYFIRMRIISPIVILFVFSLATTGLEWIAVLIGKVVYANGWHMGWTFISYFVAYSFVYGYNRLLAATQKTS